jgi:hypothetical protein
MREESSMTDARQEPSSGGNALKLVGAWALVGIPLAWGVWQVFQKSLDLFK